MPVEPDFDIRKKFKPTSVHTPNGSIIIEGEYGLVNTDSATTRVEHSYYYHNSQDSQGIDLRVGDRVMASRLIEQIWEGRRHPSYNAFWGEFRIPSSRGKVPRTLNNKTSIDFDDPIWVAIAETIKLQVPSPLEKRAREKDEEQLRQTLFEKLDSTKIKGETVEHDFSCWAGSGIEIDIFRKVGSKIIIYEAKAGKARPLDVYQLRMYWDGLVEDGKQPTEGFLVAQDKTTGVSTMLRALNTYSDMSGKKYRLTFKSWVDFGI